MCIFYVTFFLFKITRDFTYKMHKMHIGRKRNKTDFERRSHDNKGKFT